MMPKIGISTQQSEMCFETKEIISLNNQIAIHQENINETYKRFIKLNEAYMSKKQG